MERLPVGGIQVQGRDGSVSGEDRRIVRVAVNLLIAVDALLTQPEIRPTTRILASPEKIAGDFLRLASELNSALPIVRHVDAEKNLLGQFLAQNQLRRLARKLGARSKIRVNALGAQGHCQAGRVMNGRFSGCADGAGIIDVFPEICAVIDARN